MITLLTLYGVGTKKSKSKGIVKIIIIFIGDTFFSDLGKNKEKQRMRGIAVIGHIIDTLDQNNAKLLSRQKFASEEDRSQKPVK